MTVTSLVPEFCTACSLSSLCNCLRCPCLLFLKPSSGIFLGMITIMSFQRVRRLRVLKFLWLDSSWIQRKVPPLTPFCTKASNPKKPVRYTSIKKAKPKTLSDIAKILQQKTKETKERKQSVIIAAASATKPAPPNQSKDQKDVKATIISNTEVQTSTFTISAKDSSGSATPLDAETVQDIVHVEFVSFTGSSLNRAESTTACESKDVGQMSKEGLDNKTFTKISVAKDSAPESVDSGTGLSTLHAPQEALTQGDVTANISRVCQTSEVISSCDVYSASEKCTPVVSDDTVYISDGMVASEVQTPEISSAHQSSHQEESFSVAQAQYYSQPQSSQSQDFLAPNWSLNVNADKPSIGQKIINQAVGSFSDGTTDSILDISNAEVVTVVSREAPPCLEEVIVFSEPVPEVCSFRSTEDHSVSETTFAVKLDSLSEMLGESQSSVNLKDPVLAHIDVLEEEKQTEAAEKLPEAQLDPIKRLFLEKIREYSTKSQDSAGLVDAGPEYEKTFSEELTKLQRLYGGGDLTKFPEFKFSEPVLDENSSK